MTLRVTTERKLHLKNLFYNKPTKVLQTNFVVCLGKHKLLHFGKQLRISNRISVYSCMITHLV